MPDTSTESKRGRLVARRPLAPGAMAFRVPDTATMMGVSKSKVWAMIAAGDLEARKIGAATVVRRETIEAYLSGTPLVTKAAQ